MVPSTYTRGRKSIGCKGKRIWRGWVNMCHQVSTFYMPLKGQCHKMDNFCWRSKIFFNQYFPCMRRWFSRSCKSSKKYSFRNTIQKLKVELLGVWTNSSFDRYLQYISFYFLLSSAEFYLHTDIDMVLGIAEYPSGLKTLKTCNNGQSFLEILTTVFKPASLWMLESQRKAGKLFFELAKNKSPNSWAQSSIANPQIS
jgi:hypothetical protein